MAYRYLLLLMVLGLLGGCTSTGQIRQSAPTVESTTFLTEAGTDRVMEVATATLIAHNLPLKLVNERLGVIQTEPTAVDAVDPELAALREKARVAFTVRVDSVLNKRRVELRAFLYATDPEALQPVGRYLLDNLTAEMARPLSASYRPRVTREALEPLLSRMAEEETRRPGYQQTAIALGVIAGVFFLVSLLSGAFTASSGG